MEGEPRDEFLQRFVDSIVRYLFDIRTKHDAASFTDGRVRMGFEVLARFFAHDFFHDVTCCGGFKLAEKAVREVIAAEDTLKK